MILVMDYMIDLTCAFQVSTSTERCLKLYWLAVWPPTAASREHCSAAHQVALTSGSKPNLGDTLDFSSCAAMTVIAQRISQVPSTTESSIS